VKVTVGPIEPVPGAVSQPIEIKAHAKKTTNSRVRNMMNSRKKTDRVTGTFPPRDP
jgi:hypothetical protein